MASRRNYLQSLSARVLMSAVLLVLVVIPSLAWLLNKVMHQQLLQASDDELMALNYGILAVAEVEQQNLFMPSQLADPNFNLIDSGQYAVITQDQSILWQSQSLLSSEFVEQLPAPALGQSQFSQFNYQGRLHRSHSFTVSFVAADTSFQFTVHVLKDLTTLQQRLQQFQNTLLLWGAIALAILLVLQFIYLKWALSPVARLQREVGKVEQREQSQLGQNYPIELQQLANQLNSLINSLQHQQKRFANALSDLAHSLKTPLAVLSTNKSIDTSANKQLTTMADIIEHQLKRAQSGGQMSWHVGVNIADSVQQLVRTMNKIYADKQLQINTAVNERLMFKGEQRDLLEIIGNVLDNACKAANKQVLISLVDQQGMKLTIEDDGPGIDEPMRQAIFERGIRADTYQSGHGVGLAIVRDLVDSYGGDLTITRSNALGGAKFTIRLSS
ncbi:ATP-binding protein [Thalassotalea ponticola]|uniref:ATP-binding protein n=1 Tax=Thalassotalea ponticola TaxID=1523392 RepID=UPI0025B4ED3F|nr:ATP-binding protein [Thalassotalea ponticola]MDN3653085.1 ATP-binding protein [Thalassotalea ponticola]